MIRREKLQTVVTCDGCGVIWQDQEGQRPKWRPHKDVWKEAQGLGWTAKKKLQVHDFDHFCKDCSAQAVAS